MTHRLNYLGTGAEGQGYSGSIAETVSALDRRPDIDVRVMTFNPVPSANIASNYGKIKDKPFELADVGIIHGFPLTTSSRINKFNVLYTMFETDTLPNGKQWAGKYGDASRMINEYCDLLFVPCQHNADLFRDSGVKVPIEVVPNGINPNIFRFYDRRDRSPDHQFTFFMHGTLTLRKNVGAVISAFASLFRHSPNVKLVLKTQSGTLGHVDYVGMGNIEVIDALYPVSKIVKLMQDADCYLFPSRGEGFGIPPLEAMATGLPTIIGANTGMLEYANPEYNIAIPTKEKKPAQRYPKKWGDVGQWYEPDYEELKKAMWDVYKNYERYREMGEKASRWVHDNWTYDDVAEKIYQAIKKHHKGWQ